MNIEYNINIYGAFLTEKNLETAHKNQIKDSQDPYPHLGSIVSKYNKEFHAQIKIFYERENRTGELYPAVGRSWESLGELETRAEFVKSVEKFVIGVTGASPDQIKTFRGLQTDGIT